MAAYKISRAVRAAVAAQLTAHFNDALAEACTEFGLTAPTINFAAPGASYFEVPLSLEDLAWIDPDWPCCCMFTPAAQDQKLTRPRMWHGPVQVGMRFFLRWTDPDAFTNAETWLDAFEHAIVYCLQRADGGGAGIAWGAGITKEAGLAIQRGDLIFEPGDAESGVSACWYRTLDVLASFQISL